MSYPNKQLLYLHGSSGPRTGILDSLPLPLFTEISYFFSILFSIVFIASLFLVVCYHPFRGTVLVARKDI
jgi:hypothetical protein